MPDYVWRVSFILNGAKCDRTVSSGDWSIDKLKPKNKKERVKFTRRFKNTKYQDYWDVYGSAEKEVTDLLNAMSISYFTVESAYFPIASDFELSLENENELRQTGQRTPSHGKFRFTYRLTLSNSDLEATLKRVTKIASSSNEDIVKHCLTIYRRGLSYEDPFEKFFTIWRAFNAICNHFSTKRSEKQIIEDALQKLSQQDIEHLIKTYSNFTKDSELGLILANHKYDLFNYLVGKNLVNDYGKSRSQELKQALSARQPEEIIKKATLCIYDVRCKYVHGSDSQIMKQERLFTVSSAFLSPLLVLLLYKLL